MLDSSAVILLKKLVGLGRVRIGTGSKAALGGDMSFDSLSLAQQWPQDREEISRV